jgi:hypothetical protein
MFSVIGWKDHERAAFRGLHNKLRIHSDRPLAFGIAGVSNFGAQTLLDLAQAIIDSNLSRCRTYTPDVPHQPVGSTGSTGARGHP